MAIRKPRIPRCSTAGAVTPTKKITELGNIKLANLLCNELSHKLNKELGWENS